MFDGAGANAATAIQTGIRTLANGLPLDINAVTADDPTDAVDAVTAFVDHLETLQLGTAQCANGLTDIDTNADTFKDKYIQVRTGTPVCWKVVSKPNTTVPGDRRAAAVPRDGHGLRRRRHAARRARRVLPRAAEAARRPAAVAATAAARDRTECAGRPVDR